MSRTPLWHWQDDVELTAFSDGRGGVLVLHWPHTGEPVLKDELSRGDHVVFDDDGFVTEIHRPRQRKLTPRPALPRVIEPPLAGKVKNWRRQLAMLTLNRESFGS